MKVETKKQVENINNSNEKLLLSDVNNSFCNLYKKKCMGGLCSVTPFPEKCKYLKQNDAEIVAFTETDEVCYAAPKPAPKPVEVCENCRFNKPKNYHDQMWCRDCQQKNHFEMLGNKDFINLTK